MLLLERIIGSIAPHHCLGCNTEGRLLCAWCLPEATLPVPSRCYRCYAVSDNSRTCKKCRTTSKLAHVWVASEYGGVSKQLIHLLKFQRARAAAETIAAMLAATLPYLDDEVMITHIPAATSRVRTRGYDQSQLIARCLSQKLDRRHVRLLTRHGQSRQVGAKRIERLRQLDGAFRVIQPNPVKGAHVLLVDDVVTTGGTLEQAAKTLKAAGAHSVDAAIFAQKM